MFFKFSLNIVCSRANMLMYNLQNGPGKSELQEFLTQEGDMLELHDINFMLDVLVQKKKQIEAVSKTSLCKVICT